MSTQITFEEIVAHLESPLDTLILFHRGPDADAVGTAFALKRILEMLGSRAWCLCANEVPSRLRFLMYGTQDSVLAESVPSDFDVRRVISVDSASPSQLDALYERFAGKIDLMIDHHGAGESYAAHCYIRPDAAATGEILFDLVEHLATDGRIDVTEELCVNLYAAISGDTGCFRFSNASPRTHQRAAKLLSYGIDAADINHRLFECKSMDLLRAEAAGVSNLHLFGDGRIAVITFPYALKVALNLSDEHLETLIDVARSLEGVCVAICIRQPAPEGRFRASVRSSCDYDVSALCKRFDGGGHKRAAGCTIFAEDIETATEKIVSAIDLAQLN